MPLPTDADGNILPGPGRPPGSPNKVSRAAKEFLTELIDDPDVQAAVKAKVLAGETLGFFKALETIHGKPKQSTDVTIHDGYVLPAGDDVADED